MRKLGALCIALALLFTLTAFAAAEVTLFDPAKEEGGSEWACTPVHTETEGCLTLCNGFPVASRGRNASVLLSPAGEPLLDGQTFTGVYAEAFGYLEVMGEDGRIGLVSPRGELLLPAEYGDIDIISDRLIMGIRIREAGAGEAYDYASFSSDARYVAVSADVYYDGALILTLAQDEFYPGYSSSYEQYGRYFSVCSRDGTIVWYDITGRKTGATSRWAEEYDYEYDDNFDYVWYHVPTGVRAFVPGCTLSTEEVQVPFLYDYETGRVLDLTGNTVFTLSLGIRTELGEDLEILMVADGGIWFEYRSRRCLFVDWQGNCLMDIYTDREEYLYLKAVEGPLCCFASDSQVIFADTAALTVTRYPFPEGYDPNYTFGARYFALKNADGSDVLLCTPWGVLGLGNCYIAAEGRELLCIEIGGTYYLIDLQGNVVLEGCHDLAYDDSLCLMQDADGHDQIFLLTKN